MSWALMLPDERVPTSGSGHLHWTIQAFMVAGPGGELRDVVTVVVEGRNEPEAISRAQEVIERLHYRVQAVSEICSLDEALCRPSGS